MSHRAITSIALLSAVAATAHEVVWSNILGRLVGNTTWGVGLTLCSLMFGTGVGSILFGRSARRPSALLALAEIGVATGGIGLAWIALYGPLPSTLFTAAVGRIATAVDVASALLGATIPALCMGATFPLLVRNLPTSGLAAGTLRIYLIGLAGAVGGATITATVAAPDLGFFGATLAAGGLNVLCAVIAVVGLRTVEAARLDDGCQRSIVGGLRSAETARYAAASALGLSAQVIWQRTLVPYSGVSLLSFASIVVTYVLGQALGGAVLTRVRPASRRGCADWALAAAAPCSLLLLGAAPWLPAPSRDGPVSTFVVTTMATTAACILVPAMALGLSQADAVERLAAAPRGANGVATSVGAGTAAGAVAAAATSLFLLPAIGLRAALVFFGIPCWLQHHPNRGRAALAGATMTGALLFAAPGPTYFLGTAYDDLPLVYAAVGPQDTTAVVVTDDIPYEPGILRLVSNGISYSGDSLFAQRYMRLLGHLPALLASGRDRALVICVGTGATVDAVRTHGFRRIDAVDISPSTLETTRRFLHVNGGFYRDSGVTVIIEDGVRFLRGRGARYDIITLEPPPPRAPGAAALYGREFYLDARARLAPGGAIAQWLPLHGMTGFEANAIVATFASVFPGGTLHFAERNEAILLAVEGPRRFSGAAGIPHPARVDLARLGLGEVDPIRETQVIALSRLTGLQRDAPVVTAAMPITEFAPLGLPAEPESLDEWLEGLRRAARGIRITTQGRVFLDISAPFARIRDGRPVSGDREDVVGGMEALLARSPDDPYLQYTFGFGTYLERRLDDARLQGLGQRRLSAARALIGFQRERSRAR